MNYSKLHWRGDINGEDIGYVDIVAVGYYTIIGLTGIAMYIDTEKSKILEVWLEEE